MDQLKHAFSTGTSMPRTGLSAAAQPPYPVGAHPLQFDDADFHEQIFSFILVVAAGEATQLY